MNTYRKFTRAEWIAFGKRFSVVARELICLEKDLSGGLSILKLKPFHSPTRAAASLFEETA